jgi:hypothetical protein
MVRMAKSSSTALLVVAAGLAVMGGMILSPDGRLLSLALGGLIAVAVLFLGPFRVRRILALLILAAILLQAVPAYRQYHSFRDGYRNRGHRSLWLPCTPLETGRVVFLCHTRPSPVNKIDAVRSAKASRCVFLTAEKC